MNLRLAAAVGLLWCAGATAADEPPATPAPAPTLADCAAINDSVARLACYDTLAGRSSAPTADDFGKPAPEARPEPDSITARLAGAAPENWKKGLVLKLDNGQSWKITGDTSAYYPDLPANAQVVITKGMFGAYWMEVTAARRSFKVRRVS